MKRRLFFTLALCALMLSTGSMSTRAKPGPPLQNPTPQLATPPRAAGTLPPGLPGTFWLWVHPPG